MKTALNENHSNERLSHFLAKVIDEKDLARTIRRAAYLIAISYIRLDETKNPMSPEWTDESFYYLNQLAECLDPVLED